MNEPQLQPPRYPPKTDFTLDLARVIKLAAASLHHLENAARQPAEDQRRHDHVRVHHNAHLFLDGFLGAPARFVDQSFYISFAKATFLGALAAVGIDLIPPGPAVIVPQRFPN
jgi:hypothetical protein